MEGEVIGINTAIVARGQGIGFAIPVNMAVDLMPQLKAGKVVRGWLGVMIQDVNKALADALGLDNAKGVLISDTVADAPAARAGLQRGDVILELDGETVKNAHDLSSKVAGIEPETTVEVTVRRDGKRKTVPVKLGTKPDGEESATPSGDSSQQNWGMIVQELTPQLAQRLGFDRNETGIVVTKVQPGSPAAEAGLQPGDIIKEANREEVASVQDFTAALQATDDKDSLLLLLKRGQAAFYSVLQREG
jgi:serine protease Do